VCTFTHRDDAEAEIEARGEAQRLSGTLGIDAGLDVLGPTPAFLHRLRGEYRWQITVRGTDIERAFAHLPRARGWSIDVDPGP
jgi:primosomal protein N'